MTLKRNGSLKERLYSSGILKRAVTKKETGVESPDGIGGVSWFLARFAGTGCFVGYAPFAQGTFGSLVIPLVFFLLPDSVKTASMLSTIMVVSAAVVLYFLGVWAAGVCEKRWGADPGRVVIDEIVGMLVSLAFIPLSWVSVVSAFVFFRVFDIFKPPPLRRLERTGGGWGVMNDDVGAGVYANVCVRIVLLFVSGR
jgi:phosphatidylglycerophosphatase A